MLTKMNLVSTLVREKGKKTNLSQIKLRNLKKSREDIQMDEMLGYRTIGNLDDDVSYEDDNSQDKLRNTLASFVPK